jgi:hypothetical protein
MLTSTGYSALFDASSSPLQTGDIVLFAGRSRISKLICLCTGCKWSHVGMVVRPPKPHKEVWLWEALPDSKLRDVETNKLGHGVTLVPLGKRLKGLEADVAVRRLTWKRTATHLRVLAALQQELRNRPYEQKLFQLVKSAYDGPFGHNEEDLSSLFCSELVAEAYQRMGLLSSGAGSEPSSEYVPGNFAEQFNLCLCDGASLGPELSLDQLLDGMREEAGQKMCSDDLDITLELF